jgi:cell division protein FtsB
MRYWGTEDNVSRPGKTGKASRRPKRGATRAAEKPAAPSRRTGAKRTVAAGGSVKNYPFLRQFYRNQSRLSERLQKLLFAILVAALLYVFVLGESGAIKITQLRLERSGLEDNIANLEGNAEHLEHTIARLKTDDTYIEKLGRERYGYIKPGERVYRIIPLDDRR